ncbi:hypothetical protein J5Y04_26225 [Kitasatospora sp. RG8]|uniref:DUF7158 domain-containing protein n=1 Tax=Kitasatospora sp. RG8 TaxID=2820815 RepID=UPI001ADF2318|nr:hypothetical protein [Kitasatospora sp. RG8]MBP0453015.1 hypothetical protein [Kitasatospora sp. RG8]
MTAGVLGLLDGRPLPRTALDQRLAALRSGPRACALPRPGSSEDRQLTRWVAQVLLTEALCEAVAAERGLAVTGSGPAHLDQQAAVELGSVTAAAYEGSAAVRAVYESVTAGVGPSPADVAHYRACTTRPPTVVWRLAVPGGGFEADPDTLPTALGEALRAAPPGEWVTVGPWKAALLSSRTATFDPDPVPALTGAARRSAFVRWLDGERAHRLTLVQGLEHPGDPAQPDNHHRH